ncbi:hypothetical protein BC936DRAFT_138150 [Jimgerdemannia flammicorona]|uniref:Uncharacterized protein n=1 Tax=Jimgerdemannia flammicorona TaxID=994334 RepID=A0A433CVS2_9FUNG|nr:hypothetical protein BC936DRAFT_138150 [Jimgerdemannia flammicorona]
MDNERLNGAKNFRIKIRKELHSVELSIFPRETIYFLERYLGARALRTLHGYRSTALRTSTSGFVPVYKTTLNGLATNTSLRDTSLFSALKKMSTESFRTSSVCAKSSFCFCLYCLVHMSHYEHQDLKAWLGTAANCRNIGNKHTF